MTLSNLKSKIEFTQKDWDLMELVVNVLKPFKDATLMLQHRDASISMCIPFVTGIITGLEVVNADRGVMTLKRALKQNMEERFSNIEYNRHFTISTLLDSKYKSCFYREPDTFTQAKEYLTEELIELLQQDTSTQVNWVN